MKTKLMNACGVAVLLIGCGSMTDVLARDVHAPTGPARSADAAASRTLFDQGLGFGTAADVYQVECLQAMCISADVNDIGPFDDVVFKVAVVGSSSGFAGNASKISPKGGLSPLAKLCRPNGKNGNLRAYVSYTEINAAGDEFYDTIMLCHRADGTTFDPVITQILDE